METRAKQDLTRLGTNAQLKLLKRQLHEWRIMLQNQRQVRQWIQKVPISPKHLNGSMALFREKTIQLDQLNILLVRQSKERRELHLRHQQEVVELDRVIAAHQHRLANH
ncbi:MAG: hypothetical protein EOO61_06410 [Hymenobacter sp.]|nr:MAG: hypothetical protein EOO61_06410 [Hymenobacter sp.]